MSIHNPKPDYTKMHSWEVYTSNLHTEYRQCVDEGLDIEKYHELFEAVRKLPLDENRERMGDVIYDIVRACPMREGYAYNEPSDLKGIFALRDGYVCPTVSSAFYDIRDKVAGAWYGRIAGCLLGKPVEGIRTRELWPLLKGSGNYPMHRYILSTDITEEMYSTYKFPLRGRCFADMVDSMPVDDDTNYTVLYQLIVDKYGRDFTPRDVAKTWLKLQDKDAYCTAERVAFCNFVKGYLPPESAVYKNPFREWIGAQIRGDYFGYINPGEPEAAAAMAWRDASIAQTKNGIYGEMFVAAAIACTEIFDDIEMIIRGGMSQIPATSRLYRRLNAVIEDYKKGMSDADFFEDFHERYDEDTGYDWCHTISNAEIVAACLLRGGGDFGKSICMAVEQGFDTDCNAATIGSILGMRGGLSSIGKEWLEPIHGKLSTSIFGVGTVDIEKLIDKTLEHRMI